VYVIVKILFIFGKLDRVGMSEDYDGTHFVAIGRFPYVFTGFGFDT